MTTSVTNCLVSRDTSVYDAHLKHFKAFFFQGRIQLLIIGRRLGLDVGFSEPDLLNGQAGLL